MKGSTQLAKELIKNIYTTETLKKISDALEKLSNNRGFKIHSNEIINDDTLTDNQKKNQLLYIIKSIEIPTLHDFFSDQLAEYSFWLFSSGQIDYFDNFVQEFQLSTEDIKIVNITTAIKLSPEDLRAIANNLTKSFGKKTVLNHEINSSILGGAQIRVENLIFDISLRSKFRHFTKEWLKSITETEKIVGFQDDL
ncbi:F0F1 ATP synthase subunit delta [Patescibacteria group bacterium]